MPRFWLRTDSIDPEQNISPERISRLRDALGDLGASEVTVERQVTFVLDAPSSADALERADAVLLRLSWPTTVFAAEVS